MNDAQLESFTRRTKPRRIDHVVATLGREIVQGITPVGALVAPEPELEQRFEVSRGVVREAVKILAAKGLIEVRPRHGTRVLSVENWSLLDRDVLGWLVERPAADLNLLLAIQEVRSIIEPEAAALAAERGSESDLQRIDAALAAMETSHDSKSATAADKAFHLAILHATHNPVLQGFSGAINAILSAVFFVAVGTSGWFEENLPNHATAARAIRERDPDGARIAMKQVLAFTGDRLEQRKRAR
ncbi:FadR/GntR family transcriptional regulator [Methylobacterium frigidaeris]|uniref:HTH-type transcriptional repressor NanR n=1 Tax=Methylobacterium frigidaeris TaxID=2038277 RepID=A0AA37HJD7_9HYPH|nr:FadR/GntR family transcriptional regulator [Methylobacterium frigidaeris]GJD66853.1 HTH-type transcriptional repressor NanR [Methylobacterium frigidaeris]